MSCTAWKTLCDYIRNIKTCDGVKLSEFKFLSKWDKLDLEYYKSPKKKEAILKHAGIPLSERILKNLWLDMHISDDPTFYLSSAIEDANTNLTMAEFEMLIQLCQDANNHSHL